MAKKSHDAVNYRKYGTAEKHCGNCSMWRDGEKDRCSAVQDPIQWFGYCDIWDAKE